MIFDLGKNNLLISIINCFHFSNRIIKAKNRQERYKKGYILLEGKRLIADAIQAGADLITIFTTDRQILDVNIELRIYIGQE